MKKNSNVIQSSRGALFLAGLGVLGFSGTLPATRLAVPHLGPVWVGLGRALVAAVLAAGFLAGTRARRPDARQLPGLVLVALGCIVGFPLLSARALEHVPASHASVCVGLVPLATAALGALRLGERPSLRFWIASAAGSLAVVLYALGGRLAWPSPADGWLLLAALAAAIGYTEGGRLAREMGGTVVIAWALLLSAPALAVVVALTSRPDFAHIPIPAWLGFAYVSCVSMFLAFVAWYAGLARAGVGRGSQIQLVQPFLSLLWSALFLGESLTASALATAGVVVLAVAAAARARISPGPATGRAPGPAVSR